MERYEKLNRERFRTEAKKRVAAYCRVSTEKDDQANSFESQQKYFKEYIGRNPDWELYEIFADEGKSGTSTRKRTAFNRMIASAKNRGFDLIITKEISRFARNTLDSIYYTRDLKKRGIGVIFLNDNINTLDDDAELRLTIMSSIAQEESRKTSERVKWGQKRRMEQGVVFGRDLLGYDVRGGQLFINEDGAKIARLIFEKFVKEGKGAHTIARELRESGYKTITGNPMWRNTVIYKILRNEKYCGDLVQKKTITPDYLSHDKKYNHGEEEFIIFKDHHEPIISRELFDAANKILDDRALSPKGKSKHSNRYCFSGKIKCFKCGGTFSARYKKREDGSVNKTWRCIEGARHGKPHIDNAGNLVGCSTPSIRNEDAMRIMRLVVSSLDMDKKTIIRNLITSIQSTISSDTISADTVTLQRQAEEIMQKKTRLLDLYMNNDISRNEYIAAKEKYGNKTNELNELIHSMGNQDADIKKQSDLMSDINSAVNEIAADLTFEEEFYRNLLNHMVVHENNRIDIYLKLLPYKWQYTASNGITNTSTGGDSEHYSTFSRC